MVTKLETMNALTNGSTQFLGIVITHWDTLVSSRRFEEVDLRRALPGSGGQVLATKIPIDNQLERLEPGANTTGARAYADLAEEVVQNVNARERSAVEVRG